jgi:XTP/dITP diphosphohydrolase
MKILLASNNKHKAKEILDKVQEAKLEVEILMPGEVFPDVLDVEETGQTLEENAFLKANFFYKKFNLPTLADDTGLEVDALGGEPGVFSARFSGIYGDDMANRLKLLNLLKNVPEGKRTARFRTVICFIDNGNPTFFEGVCLGEITTEQRGEGGFGYDSIFVPKGYSLTFAEMSFEEKNRISHRSRAIERFVDFLKKLL